MTKNDIAIALCRRTPDLQKSSAVRLVETFTDILSQAFAKGDNIYLRGFGTFEVKATPEKTARNINAGTPVIIPAGRTVKFKLSKQLKNQINNGN